MAALPQYEFSHRKKLKHTLCVYMQRLQGCGVKTETYFRMTATPAPRCYSDMSR